MSVVPAAAVAATQLVQATQQTRFRIWLHLSWLCAVWPKLLPRRHFFDAVLSANGRQQQKCNKIYATNQMFLFLHFYRPKRLSKIKEAKRLECATHVGLLLCLSFIFSSSTGSQLQWELAIWWRVGAESSERSQLGTSSRYPYGNSLDFCLLYDPQKLTAHTPTWQLYRSEKSYFLERDSKSFLGARQRAAYCRTL